MSSPASRVCIIAAMAQGRVIGRDNRLPWHLPADLAHFRRLTLDKPIIMGRHTWESLPGLLPRRTHIVVTGNEGYEAPGCLVVTSPAAAVAAAAGAAEVCVIGGARLYRSMLPLTHRMHLTLVAAAVEGDTFFPNWNPAEWRERARELRRRDERNPYDLTFVTLERRTSGS